jgi:D-alanine transfer protein
VRKIAAFLTAGVLFLCAVFGIHGSLGTGLQADLGEFSAWAAEEKFLSHQAMEKNMDSHTLVVFGSSEFQHGQKTPYHPGNLFSGKDFYPMLIGAGYYQSLSHAITLAALEPSMENRKAALIVAPQWFRKSGVKKEAFASRFSEVNFLAMLRNPKLSNTTKKAIAKRADQLLQADPPTQKRMKQCVDSLLGDGIGMMDSLYLKLHLAFMEEKSLVSVMSKMKTDGVKHRTQTNLEDTPPDWDSLRRQAEQDGKAGTQSNPFYVLDSYYEKNLLPELEERKGSGTRSSYCNSPEYDDLRLFLQVCQELEITPLIVNVPVNGWWYDYTQFPKEDRQQYYENIREIAKEYGAQVADFSGEEYTPYFLEDTIHLGWKGWVDVNEALYRFGTENSVA